MAVFFIIQNKEDRQLKMETEREQVQEQEGTEETNQFLSTSEAEGESSEAETAETEAEPKEGEEAKEDESKEEQTDFEKRVQALAKSIADKTTRTLERQRNDLQQKVTELETELNDRTWNRELQALFNEDTENLGEEEANKRKASRERLYAEIKKYRENDAKVRQMAEKLGTPDIEGILKELNSPNLSEAINKLSLAVRDTTIRNRLWKLIFPEDKDKLTQFDKYMEKFTKTRDWDEVEIVFGGIEEGLKGKKQSHVPDSGKNAGSPPGELSLKGEKAVQRGFEKLRSK